ncbi:FtsX-like permease family protein [uncultured Rhodoblastus sp.]|uniref:ABC transporter permease n=1 Tax=uncultured Rhodoblastus sp. TaxID=543037 RepID=UPI0025FE6D35|nr:FtsX-like permease family protein [uncultured Rhodoblastus sp.]
MSQLEWTGVKAPRLETPSRGGAASWAVFRFALRDLRGGLRFYGVFIACLVLGVTALVGVAATSRALRDGLAQQGAVLIGGDVSFSRAQGPPGAGELAFLQARGTLSKIVTLRAMARKDGAQQASLVEIKAIDAGWPLVGAARIEPDVAGGRNLVAVLGEKDGAFGLVADRAVATRLGVEPGDRLAIGAAQFILKGWLEQEPDSFGGAGFGPRVTMSEAGLAATGLILPGSLARTSLRLKLPGEKSSDADVAAVQRDFAAAFPDSGFEVRDRGNPSPQLSRNIERFAQFLTLIGLTALVCGGVGVGNAIRGLIDRKRKTLAILKALGASGADAARFVLIQAMLVAVFSSLVGVLLGLALPHLLVALMGGALPFQVEPHVHPRDGLSGLVFGLLTAFAFAAAPLDRARLMPATTLLRESAMQEAGAPQWRGRIVAGLSACALFAFALLIGDDRRLTAQFGSAVIVSFALLYGVARGIMFLARRAPHSRLLPLRLAVANLHRPGALTPSFLISLGLGLTLLTALVGVERNLRGEIGVSLPKDSPSFFFLDVQSAQAEAFQAFLRAEAPEGALSVAPMLRGRIVRVNGVASEQVKPTDKARWALEGDRGITFAAKIPAGSQLLAGEWWPEDHAGPPLVSMEAEVAQGLGLKVGDTISVNVLGRGLTAKIANLRKVNWRNFGINFVMVFSPDAFAGAPFTRLMTLTFAQKPDISREAALLAESARRFPAVAGVSMRETLATLDDLLGKLSLAIRSAASLAFIVSALVLAGALAAGQRARIYEAVVLKVLGATRPRLLAALALEFALLGAATAAFGLLAGETIAYLVSTRALDMAYQFAPLQAAGLALAAVVFAILIGLAGTWRILGEKPARWLREA